MGSVDRFKAAHERSYPYVGGLFLGTVALVWKARIGAEMSSLGIDSGALVSATFNVMITLTALLFSVFVLAVAPGGGFIERMFGSVTFKVFKRYVIEALLLGALSVVICLPFMIMKRDAAASVWNSVPIEALWVAVAAAATLAFYRVAHTFLVIVSVDARMRRKARRPA